MAIIGILSGQIYRSDLANIKAYRIPSSVVGFSVRFLLPLIGAIRPPRRSNRALPDDSGTSSTSNNGSSTSLNQNDEIVTTARTSASSVTPRGRNANSDEGGGTGASVVREWVDELTGRTDRANAGIRVPTDAEITQLTNMFPDIPRDVVVGALQRRYAYVLSRFAYDILIRLTLAISPNIEGAVETLLSSQR